MGSPPLPHFTTSHHLHTPQTQNGRHCLRRLFHRPQGRDLLRQEAGQPAGSVQRLHHLRHDGVDPQQQQVLRDHVLPAPSLPQEIAKQIDYIVACGWTPCLEFASPETAFTMSHDSGFSQIVSSATAGYYDNRYWAMWKLPMF